MHTAFYLPDGDAFLATPLTRGPWDVRFQHGGPPSALFARALAEEGFFLARLTVALLRPVPIGRITLEVERAVGRTVRRPTALMYADGDLVGEASAVLIKRVPLSVPPVDPGPDWPDPTSLAPYAFTFFPHEIAYHRAIDLRLAFGEWGSTPIGFWARLKVPLVEGTPTTAAEQVITLADAQSGMGVPLDPHRFTFVNPDLTVYFERDPTPGWTGFDIRSVAGPHGSGLAQSAVRDELGLVARSAQALVVASRGA